MIRRLKADLRTLEWMDALELLSIGGDALELLLIGGFICSALVLSVIWSGNLP